MRVKLGKQKLGQYVELPGHCSKCIFQYNSWSFCIYRIRCRMYGYFNNCTSEDIFHL